MIHDTATAASYIQRAHEKGAKVIAYDRAIVASDLDYYVSHDSYRVGAHEQIEQHARPVQPRRPSVEQLAVAEVERGDEQRRVELRPDHVEVRVELGGGDRRERRRHRARGLGLGDGVQILLQADLLRGVLEVETPLEFGPRN